MESILHGQFAGPSTIATTDTPDKSEFLNGSPSEATVSDVNARLRVALAQTGTATLRHQRHPL